VADTTKLSSKLATCYCDWIGCFRWRQCQSVPKGRNGHYW
jgi:hypothetical protein